MSARSKNKMISPNQYNPEKSTKIMHPLSPHHKRKNIEYNVNTPVPTHMDYQRKDSNPTCSPNHYYTKNGTEKSTTFSRECEVEPTIRELMEKIAKMGQKMSQHEAVLMKLT